MTFYINDLIKHSSLHKQRLWNLLKRFQFDEKLYLLIHTIIGIDCRESEHLGFLKKQFCVDVGVEKSK